MNNISPCEKDIQTYFYVVFGFCEGFIPCRSFPEKGADQVRPPHNIWIEADDNATIKAFTFAKWADKEKVACYVIPGTVAKEGQGSSTDVLQMQTVLVDLDTGNTEAKLKTLTDNLLDPTLIVESGGVTEDGHKKLHVYWQLSEPAEGIELKKLLKLRHHIALSIGGDIHFQSAHQPIRVAGSTYHKGGNYKLVTIRSYNPVEYDLDDLIEFSENLPTPENLPSYNQGSDFLDFNNAAMTFEEVLTSKVHEGGIGENTRFNHLSRVMGYWIRRYHDGLIPHEKVWEEVSSFNQANVTPPQTEGWLNDELKRLWKKHVKKHGEPKPQAPEAVTNNILSPIDPLEWQGMPPAREWIVEGWLPRGYVTALYGDGGVGKSLLAQQLMTCLATGKPFLDIKLIPSKVYALMCEDDYNELWRRQFDINKHFGLAMADLSNIRFISRVGENNLLMTFDNSNVGQLTEFFENLHSDVIQFHPDLVVLDTAADLFSGNENNRTQVRQFIQSACAKLARSVEGAVLLCAHPSESGMQKGTGSGGSTAWNNTVRSRWYLKRRDDKQASNSERVLSRVKSNYASVGQEEYLEWQNGAFVRLNPLNVSARITGQTQGEKHNAERDRKTDIIMQLIDNEAAEGRIYTANQFGEKFEDNKGNHQYQLGSKRSIADRIAVAATQGLIKFFDDPGKYGLKLRKCAWGYVCTQNTMIKSGETIDSITGEVISDLVRVLPTLYKCTANGALMPVENPEIWVMPKQEGGKKDAK